MGYYNKEGGAWPLQVMFDDHPTTGKMNQLSDEQILLILDAPMDMGITYVNLGDPFGEIVIDEGLKNRINQFLTTGSENGSETIDLNVKTLGGKTPTKPGVKRDGEEGMTYRWPRDSKVELDTDYVFFQFGKYIPPFSQDVRNLRLKTQIDLLRERENINEGTNDGIQDTQIRDALIEGSTTSATYEMYRNSEALDVTNEMDIMLPMPQDLSNELQAQWQGKQFTATGRAAVAALGAGQFSHAKEVVKNIAGNAKAIQTALNTAVLNTIPGVGGNLSFNDVSGSTRGIVINPNAELLYDSPEMREIGMIFKLVAQNDQEAKDIQKIVDVFREASLPSWGGKGLQKGIFDGESEISGSLKEGSSDPVGDRNKDGQFDVGGEDNWIRIPKLCQFRFMTGDKVNRNLVQFKPCAIQTVEVNYTPDGTYAAYRDGAPVAVELRINFMETKLIFAQEVQLGY